MTPQPCPVCSEPTLLEVVRASRVDDWEYRYAAQITRYWEPNGNRHRCRLQPRKWEPTEPVPIERPETPTQRARRRYGSEM